MSHHVICSKGSFGCLCPCVDVAFMSTVKFTTGRFEVAMKCRGNMCVEGGGVSESG